MPLIALSNSSPTPRRPRESEDGYGAAPTPQHHGRLRHDKGRPGNAPASRNQPNPLGTRLAVSHSFPTLNSTEFTVVKPTVLATAPAAEEGLLDDAREG
jgi:hypothetical protein